MAYVFGHKVNHNLRRERMILKGLKFFFKKVDNPKKVWIAEWQEAGTSEMTIGKPPG